MKILIAFKPAASDYHVATSLGLLVEQQHLISPPMLEDVEALQHLNPNPSLEKSLQLSYSPLQIGLPSTIHINVEAAALFA